MSTRHRAKGADATHLPQWTPARELVPDLLPHLIYVGPLAYRDATIHQYKHVSTRLYINLDASGQAWRLSVDPTTSEIAGSPIAVLEARRALGLAAAE
jgi:hypothetical protein